MCRLCIKVSEESLNLILVAMTYFEPEVDPARPHEGGVQPLRVVCGEEGQPRLGGHHAVQGVQEAGQRHLGLAAVSSSDCK